MADASYAQSSFLGGQFSDNAQGRFDDKKYPEGMNVCLNSFPIEEGAWCRRSGTLFGAMTRNGVPAMLKGFRVSDSNPYVLEFTNGHLRFYSLAGGAPQLVMTPETQVVTGISNANPGVVSLAGAVPADWVKGDILVFGQDVLNNTTSAHPLFNSQWQLLNEGAIQVGANNELTLVNPLTGLTLDGTTFTLSADVNYFLNKVTDLATPFFNNAWENVRVVQTGALDQLQTQPQAIVLCPGPDGKGSDGYPPQLLTFTSPQNSPVFGTFTFNPALFLDGPYFDPPGNGAQLIASATSGIVTLTVSYQTYSASHIYAQGDYVTAGGLDYQSLVDNNLNNTPASSPTQWQLLVAGAAIGGVGFQSSDVGRAMRLFSQPQPWSSNVNYTNGQSVTFGELYYTAVGTTGAGTEPDTNPLVWAVTPSAANMVWGRITAVNSATQVSFQILAVPSLNGETNTASLLYSGNTQPITQFQMGLYSATTGYPTNGVYYQGRLWLAGLVPNRFDASTTNGTLIFSPTAADGTDADNNSISEILNSDDVENIKWWSPSSQGLIVGTEGGEWLIQASQLNDPITPTSIQAMRVSTNKVANIEPIKAPMATIFVQKSGHKLLEYFPDVFSGKYSTRNLSLRGKVFGKNGFVQIAYQQELNPVVWACDTAGQLYGCSYKRESPFATEEATIVGWHPHVLGSGRNVLSVVVTPGSQVNQGESLEALTMCTQDPATGVCFVETMAKLFEEDDTLLKAWFTDAGVTPSFADISGNNVTFYGLDYLNGKTVDVWGAGLDLGSFTVANGEIVVPFSTSNPLFTQALLAQLSGQSNAQGLSTWLNYGTPYVVPNGLTSWVDTGAHLGTEGSAWGLPNYDQDYVLIPNTSSISLPDGVRKMKMREGNSYITSKTTAQLFAGVQQMKTYGAFNIDYPAAYGVGVGACQDLKGQFYFRCTSNNLSPIAKFDKNMNFIGAIGQPCDTITHSGVISATSFVSYPWYQGVSFGVAASDTLAACTVNGFDYLVTVSNLSTAGDGSHPEIGVFNATTFSYIGRTSSQHLNSCAGLVVGPQQQDRYNQYGKSTVYGLFVNNSGATTVGVEITAIQPPATTLLTSWLITPATIDPTWTHVLSAASLCYDTTDGNLIFYVSTNDAVTNTKYVVKVNPNTQTIVWTAAVPDVMITNAQTRIKYGQLCWIASTANKIYFLNTANGAYTTASVAGGMFLAVGVQFYDDVLGLLCYQGQYNGGGASWPQLNPGSTTFSGDWGCVSSPTTQKGPNSIGSSYQVPFSIGFSFDSRGQLLRKINPQEVGSRNGPALGKTRRTHMAALLLQNCPTAGVASWGTVFGSLLPINPTGQDQTTPLVAGGLFSGVYWDTIQDDYTFDSMLAWEVSRPYPMSVTAVECFLHTQDR